MPKGPKGERRPADLNKRAFAILQIATGETVDPGKPPPAAKGGKAGGPARAKALSPEKRKAIAEKAASARWKKKNQLI
jgi:hypothetical protein